MSQVDCWLLTGATGLVGRFVLAELLRAGEPVAALVRDRAAAPAAARIEECLAPFETDVLLLRPRTIAFDLTLEDLAISQLDRQWLVGKRLGVIHSAASIRFVANSPQDEPYLSNVVGTRNLLEFLKPLEVECFHYVSTAYVTSRAISDVYAELPRKEIPVDAGTRGGNDYETSKIAAEQLIQDCTWLKSKTFLRPSIIVGDSRSSYTSTFHGFYAPLQIGDQLAKSYGFSQESGAWFRNQLGLKETDTKNFVPVDWVARAIARIALQPALHGAIYHLTNPKPVTCIDIQTAIGEALSKRAAQAGVTAVTPVDLPASFREKLVVYESYFNSDPLFDCVNTLVALPDQPCPVVDVYMLVQLADYALRCNFGWPRPNVTLPTYASLFAKLSSISQERNEQVSSDIPTDDLELVLVGPGASTPLCFQFNSGRWNLASWKRSNLTRLSIIATASDIANCIGGSIGLTELAAEGRAVCMGRPTQGWQAVLGAIENELRES